MRAGAFVHEAADFAGIGASTLREWVARGEAEAERRATGARPIPDLDGFVAFSEGVKEWRATAKVGAIAVVRRVMQIDKGDEQTPADDANALRAATFYLSASDPEHWGRRTIDVNATVKHEFVSQLDADLEAAAAQLSEEAARERAAKALAGPADAVPSGPTDVIDV